MTGLSLRIVHKNQFLFACGDDVFLLSEIYNYFNTRLSNWEVTFNSFMTEAIII